MESLFIGNFKAAFSWRWIEFQDFREYSPSDDAKYIDWARSTQEWTTIMRRYREDKEGTIFTIIDNSETLYYWKNNEKITLVLEIIDLLGRASIQSWENFWWYILSEDKNHFITPKKSITGMHELQNFWDFELRSSRNALSLKQFVKKSMKRSVIFILSDSLNIDEKSFKMLSLKHDVVYIHISSDFENTLMWNGLEIFKSSRFKLWIDLSNNTKKQEYKEKRAQKLKAFQKSMHTIWIDTLFLNEKSSLFAEFLKLMKRKEQRNIF